MDVEGGNFCVIFEGRKERMGTILGVVQGELRSGGSCGCRE